jgi:drug/metabolite transporter (DMT)-like permease
MDDTTLLPLLVSLAAACLFGAHAVIVQRGLRYVDAQTGAMITICTAALIFWGLFVWRAPSAPWRSPAVWVFASNGLLHPMVSMLLSFEANRRMGATVSATISATTPLFAAGAAVLLLGERLSLALVLGILGIVCGIAVLSGSRRSARSWGLASLVFPFGAALVRAFNHVWGKFGLTLLSAPLMAATLSFSVSGSLAVLTYRARTGRLPLRLPRGALFWYGLSGITVSGAILCMYTALALGAVVVVSPVSNTFPLFTLAWSLLFRQEAFSRRIGVGVVLVVAGVLLIGLG